MSGGGHAYGDVQLRDIGDKSIRFKKRVTRTIPQIRDNPDMLRVLLKRRKRRKNMSRAKQIISEVTYSLAGGSITGDNPVAGSDFVQDAERAYEPRVTKHLKGQLKGSKFNPSDLHALKPRKADKLSVASDTVLSKFSSGASHWQFMKDSIVAKLKEQKVKDLKPATIKKALSGTIASKKLINFALELIEDGELTMDMVKGTDYFKNRINPIEKEKYKEYSKKFNDMVTLPYYSKNYAPIKGSGATTKPEDLIVDFNLKKFKKLSKESYSLVKAEKSYSNLEKVILNVLNLIAEGQKLFNKAGLTIYQLNPESMKRDYDYRSRVAYHLNPLYSLLDLFDKSGLKDGANYISRVLDEVKKISDTEKNISDKMKKEIDYIKNKKVDMYHQFRILSDRFRSEQLKKLNSVKDMYLEKLKGQ
jgi:hypothetical protein